MSGIDRKYIEIAGNILQNFFNIYYCTEGRNQLNNSTITWDVIISTMANVY